MVMPTGNDDCPKRYFVILTDLKRKGECLVWQATQGNTGLVRRQLEWEFEGKYVYNCFYGKEQIKQI